MKATQPDNKGHFGKYGGMYVPETLMEPLNELTRVFKKRRMILCLRRSFSTVYGSMSAAPLHFVWQSG